MRILDWFILGGASVAIGWSQSSELKTVQAVLERYQQSLGGVGVIQKVQSETRQGEGTGSGWPASRNSKGIDVTGCMEPRIGAETTISFTM
jgi:hypothetical protein